jgi:hypothetical protein
MSRPWADLPGLAGQVQHVLQKRPVAVPREQSADCQNLPLASRHWEDVSGGCLA